MSSIVTKRVRVILEKAIKQADQPATSESKDEASSEVPSNNLGILKEQLACLDKLESSATFTDTTHGTNDQRRPIFVGLQAIFEFALLQLLEEDKLKSVLSVTHTPTQATPLCKKPGKEGKQKLDIDASIVTNADSFKTVAVRPMLARKLLKSGAVLAAIYGKDAKRTPDMMQTYQQTCESFKNSLHNVEMPNLTMDDFKSKHIEFSGATYLIETMTEEQELISIKASQANNPSADLEWGFWAGDIKNPDIAERKANIHKFLIAYAEFSMDQCLPQGRELVKHTKSGGETRETLLESRETLKTLVGQLKNLRTYTKQRLFSQHAAASPTSAEQTKQQEDAATPATTSPPSS